MIINFRVYRINQGMRKLTRTSTLINKNIYIMSIWKGQAYNELKSQSFSSTELILHQPDRL